MPPILQTLQRERPLRDWPWATLLPRSLAPALITGARWRSLFSNAAELRSAGVSLIPWADASPSFQKQASGARKRFADPALNSWPTSPSGNHLLVVVPPNVEAAFQYTGAPAHTWPRISVLIGDGARVVWRDRSRPRNPRLTGESLFFLCGKGSVLQYALEQDVAAPWLRQVSAVGDTHSRVHLAGWCGFHSHHWLSAAIHQTGWHVQSDMAFVFHGQNDSRAYVRLTNNHGQQQGAGAIRAAAIGSGSARLQIDGWIRIGQASRGTHSLLAENAILLSEKARIDAVPNLEILQNDVKAFHAATVGRLSDTELWYLMSRGLTEEQARSLLVNAFIRRVIDTIPNSAIRRSFIDRPLRV